MTDKLERLLDLTAELLHARRPISAEEIHDRLPGYPGDKDSFKRQFERDKRDLREMGIPLRVEPVPGTDPVEDGYRIDPGEYYLPDPGFAPEELAALHLAASAVRVDGFDLSTGLRKLGAPAATAPGDAMAVLTAPPHLATLFDAVGRRQRLHFGYGSRDRTVDPRRLVHRRGRWYLQAHDVDADGSRAFRLDRLVGPVRAEPDGSATADDAGGGPLQLDSWAIGDEPPIVAEVRIAPRQARLAARVLDHVESRWLDDGSVVFRIEVRRPPGLYDFVVGFLDDAELLGPPELRAGFVAWLDSVASGRVDD